MVERSLSMREVRGSIPRISIVFFFALSCFCIILSLLAEQKCCMCFSIWPTPSKVADPKTRNRSRAQQKISQIRSDCFKGVVTCYRCRERNHTSRDYRNALICFERGRLGHKSKDCRAIVALSLVTPKKLIRNRWRSTARLMSMLFLSSFQMKKTRSYKLHWIEA
jgi:hypothetical protein